jgi:predicted aconitase
MTPDLTSAERAFLDGAHGEAGALAMRVVVAAAELLRARRLVPIASAHVDGCLYHGDGGVAFAEKLVAGGGRVAVPTTLNVGALDLLHPGRVRADAHRAAMASRQMDAYLALGCAPTWTCAPYQAGHRPAFGEQVAWGESNAIAFANSVLGARTERYGDFLDACCALTGRAPLHGLHQEENRRATVVVDATGVPDGLKTRDVFFPVLGTWLGREVGREVAAVVGLPATTTEDQLKALGAAAASSGAVALFHVVGVLAQAAEADPLGNGVPWWVEKDFRAYLRCGILAHGFARARCEDCGHERLIPFSCKGRGICPSCNTPLWVAKIATAARVPGHRRDQVTLTRSGGPPWGRPARLSARGSGSPQGRRARASARHRRSSRGPWRTRR